MLHNCAKLLWSPIITWMNYGSEKVHKIPRWKVRKSSNTKWLLEDHIYPSAPKRQFTDVKNLKQTIIFSHPLQIWEICDMMIIFLYCNQRHLFEFIWTPKRILPMLLNHCQKLADIATESLKCTSKFVFTVSTKKFAEGTGGRWVGAIKVQLEKTPVSSQLSSVNPELSMTLLTIGLLALILSSFPLSSYFFSASSLSVAHSLPPPASLPPHIFLSPPFYPILTFAPSFCLRIFSNALPRKWSLRSSTKHSWRPL